MKPGDPCWYSEIETPMTVASPDALRWDVETDIAVVGAGCAGASAALEARAGGAKVMLLDRFVGGGASALSGGIVYLGGGTKYQQQAGYQDTPDNMFNYLKLETRGIVSDDTLRDFCNESVDNLAWLEKHGVRFEASMSPVKTFYPTNKYFLYYSGNELVKEFTDVATSAPRGHRVKWNGFSGEGLMKALLESCRHHGVDMWMQTRVTQLIQDNDGRILGMKVLQVAPESAHARRFQMYYKMFSKIRMYVPPLANLLREKMSNIEQEFTVTRLVRAHRAVVLSAGGFVFNRRMMKHHALKYYPGAPLGSPGCNGEGIRLGESVGAVAANMDRGSSWRFINPPKSWVEGIMVNREGQRFVNESSYGARIGEAMAEHNEGAGWLIFDQAMLKDVLLQLMPGKVWLMLQTAPALLSLLFNTKHASSLSALAARCGLPADALSASVARYNEQALAGLDADFHKAADYLRPITQGPFHAMDVSISNKLFLCPTISLGGLQVDERNGLVLRENGQPAPNLYAVGRTAVGVASRSYVSGLSLADCVFTGRRAGRHMTREKTGG
jgi:3-oxo-5alpha-steroid 4-dehydrogenase